MIKAKDLRAGDVLLLSSRHATYKILMRIVAVCGEYGSVQAEYYSEGHPNKGLYQRALIPLETIDSWEGSRCVPEETWLLATIMGGYCEP